jgi:toxin YoeB
MIKAWTETGWEDYVYWQGQDKKTLKKINTLLKDIERNGVLMGIGKPEALKWALSGWFSREIDEANRLVYRIVNGTIEVSQCRGHYNDK